MTDFCKVGKIFKTTWSSDWRENVPNGTSCLGVNLKVWTGAVAGATRGASEPLQCPGKGGGGRVGREWSKAKKLCLANQVIANLFWRTGRQSKGGFGGSKSL